ncbi:hypothetical protein HYS11_00445, partial [Candidatus Gottesmanbacteria bacterium]|nr:hypothetical protein [Candidatus Gottesmanbacteria bacterium]
MALYRYVKKSPFHRKHVHRRAHIPSHHHKNRVRFPLTAALLMGSGILLIAWVLWPIIAFELFDSARFASTIRPIPDEIVSTAFENQFGRLLPSSGVDYTKARNWFPKLPATKEGNEKEIAYHLSIPKLRIKNANVVIGGDDLDKSLIHYGGTAIPGDYGNGVIFGHSVLPVFFNPENYLTIFSTL